MIIALSSPTNFISQPVPGAQAAQSDSLKIFHNSGFAKEEPPVYLLSEQEFNSMANRITITRPAILKFFIIVSIDSLFIFIKI
jgi:hypothetical protein